MQRKKFLLTTQKNNLQDKRNPISSVVSYCYELALELWSTVKSAIEDDKAGYIYYCSKDRCHKPGIIETTSEYKAYCNMKSTGLGEDTLLLSASDLFYLYYDLLSKNKASQMAIIIYQCIMDDLKLKLRQADLENYYLKSKGEKKEHLYPVAARLIGT